MLRFRNLTRYIIIFLLNIYVMISFHSYINLILLVGMVCFLIYSLMAVEQVRAHLKVEMGVPLEPMKKEQEFFVRFKLTNPTYFPLVNATISLMVENRFYGEWGSHTLNLPVRAKGVTEAEYPIVMDYCGRFVIAAEKIKIMDLLGIKEYTIPLSVEKECLIVPDGPERNQEAGQIYINGVSEAMESNEKGYDFSDVSGIREYIPGDKLQNIHWKLSVKKDELMVKERVSVSAQQLNVLVELVNNEEMCAEAILELTDSITRSFVKQNLPFTIFYYSTNLGELRECLIGNEIERVQCLEMLLYDKCYRDSLQVEALFCSQYPVMGNYLYIGKAGATGLLEDAIEGAKGTVAELRKFGE